MISAGDEPARHGVIEVYPRSQPRLNFKLKFYITDLSLVCM